MTGSAPIDRDRLNKILGSDEPELTCDECFDALDRYVELELAGADSERAIPGLRAHLQGCPACREDHNSLLAYLDAEPG
jgi:hypothetical protein